MRKSGKCIHFNGTMNDCCAAGVNYKELAGSEPGWALKLPCGLVFNKKVADPTGNVVECAKYQEPTAEEIAEDEKWMQERMEKHRKVGPVIIALKERYRIPGKGKPKFRSGQEKIPCPACGTGELHVAISGYNGHTQGRCSTEGCVSWIE